MKHILFLILDHGEVVDQIFKTLKSGGYNATVLNARSIKHLLEDESASDDIHFFNISHIERHLYSESTFCYFIVDEDRLENLKQIIRNETDSFKKIKGGMFSYKVENFEGSF